MTIRPVTYAVGAVLGAAAVTATAFGITYTANASDDRPTPGATSVADPAAAPAAQPTGEPAVRSSAKTAAKPAAQTAARPAGATAAAVPKRDRQFMLEVVGSSLNLVLTVNAQGEIGTHPIGADTGDRELFVLVPTGKPSAPSFPVSHLETAVLNSGGEHHCVTARTDGGKAATVGCDTRSDAQDLQVIPDVKDASGRPTFELMLGGQALEVDRDGRVRTEIVGDNLPQTRFVFVDAGKAPARAGD